MNSLKIAIIGARGIGNYGGFETVVSELAQQLVHRGYIVYCSCEKDDGNLLASFNGVKLIYFPTKMPSNYKLRKVFEIIYDVYFNAVCALYYHCDIVYSLGLGANIFTLFPRLLGKKSMVNVDGVEWQRAKFSGIEKAGLRLFFKLAVLGANCVVVDNKSLIPYIREAHRGKVVYIPYGVNESEIIPWDKEKLHYNLKQKGIHEISPHKYWLVVARLEPENNIDVIVKAYLASESVLPLVITGDFVSLKYEQFVKDTLINKAKEKEVIFTGGIYNQDLLNMLRQNCLAYLHGHSVGGTNPSLLEAMIMHSTIIAHDNEFNREVCGNSALYFSDVDDLKNKIELVESHPEHYRTLKSETYRRAKENYSWSRVVSKYESMFSTLFQ